MAPQQSVARKQSRSKGESRQKAESPPSQNGHDEDLAKYEQELADYLQKRIKPGLNRGAIPLLARSIAHEVAQWEPPDTDDEADDESSAEGEDDFDQEEPDAEAEDESSAEGEDDFEEEEPDAEAEDESSAEGDDDFDEEEPDAEAEDESSAQADDPDEDEDEAEASAESDDDGDLDGMSDFEAEMRDLQGDLGDDWIVRFSVQGDDAWLTAEKEDGSQRLEAPDASVLFRAVKLLAKSGGRSA